MDYADKLYSWVEGEFRQHDPSAGSQDWLIDLGWGIGGLHSMMRTTAVANSRAFVTGNNNLYAIDLDTGAVAWSVSGGFTGTPAVANGIVYGISAGFVKAYNAWTGAYVGVYVGEPSIIDQPIVVDDAIVFASAAHTFVYDLAGFTPITTLGVGGRLSMIDGHLYVATNASGLQSFTFTSPAPSRPNLTADWEPWSFTQLGVTHVRAARMSVTNTGTAASSPCRIEMWSSDDASLDSSDFLVRSVNIGPLAVGGALSTTVYTRAGPLLAGTYMILSVDALDSVTETNENNDFPSARLP